MKMVGNNGIGVVFSNLSAILVNCLVEVASLDRSQTILVTASMSIISIQPEWEPEPHNSASKIKR